MKKVTFILIFVLGLCVTGSAFAEGDSKGTEKSGSGLIAGLDDISVRLQRLEENQDKILEGQQEIREEMKSLKIWVRRYGG